MTPNETAAKDPEGQVPPLVATDFASIRPYTPGRHEWKVRAAVLIVAAAVLIPNAGAFGLWDCWETHYGEVARYMNETGDFLSPWWGYKDQIGTEPKTGEWFFSKPVLIMYGEILAMKVIGLSDWAIRIPWALLGTLGVFFAYVVMSRAFSRRVGLLSAGLLLTSPLWFFLSRQAITDMPFVGTLTIGLLFFVHAYFSPRFEPTNRRFLWYGVAALGLFLLTAVPQFVNIALDLEPDAAYENFGFLFRAWLLFQKTGLYHAAIYFAATGVVLALIAVPMWRAHKAGTLFTPESKDLWCRRFSLWVAYTFLGYATMGKGLLGFMLPGAILLLYLLLTGEWRALRRLEILRGTLMLCLTMLPWYLGMFAKHGNAFYTRFLVHDHFNRIGAGVHQIDSGTFEHFIKWLSIGTFPWVALAPLLIWGIARLRLRDASPHGRLKLFLYVWAFFAYMLFTISATKFHHYIFPALPPFILLIAIHVDELLEDRSWVGRLAAIAGLGIMLSVGTWVRSDVQAFRNMFTYKYDRGLPDHPPLDPDEPVASGVKKTWRDSTFYEFTNPTIQSLLQNESLEYENAMTAYLVVASVGFVLLAFPGRTRRIGLATAWGGSVLLALWCLNWYMPMLSPSWSQKYLFEDYYKRCTPEQNPPEVEDAFTPILAKMGMGFVPEYFGSTTKRVCKEDIVAWLITWRGETYYTSSEIKPLMKANQLAPYLETLNKGRAFFALTQGGRGSGLKSALDRETEKLRKKGLPEWVGIKSWDVVHLNQENFFFNLVKATPITMDEAAIRPPPEDERDEGVPEKTTDTPPAM
jgi:4-amino-4-deoxy-L-arabinose transferase-like glycosyltransferase